MERQQQDRYLSTREVAEKCGTSESTVRYSARVGTLNGAKIRNAWQFAEAEATAFCEGLRERKKKRIPLASRTRRLFLRRLDTRDFVNYLAAVVTIATFLGLDRHYVAGILLATSNLAWAALGYVRAKIREPKKSDIVEDRPVEPAAIRWKQDRDESTLYRAGQSAAVLLVVGFVAINVFPLSVGNQRIVTGPNVALAPPPPTQTQPDVGLPRQAPTAVDALPPRATLPAPPTPDSAPVPTEIPDLSSTEPTVALATNVPPTRPSTTSALPPTDPPYVPPDPDPCGWPPDVIALSAPEPKYVDAESVNLRSGPNPGCDVIQILSRGTSVAVQSASYAGVDGQWVFIETEDGSTGWVLEEFLNSPVY